MGNLKFNTYYRVLKVQWKYCIVFAFILAITLAITEILFYDITPILKKVGSLNNLTGNDKEIFYTLYSGGMIALQGYVFGFAFFLLLSLIYYFFSAKLLIDNFKKDIVVLKIRLSKFSKSEGKYLSYMIINIIVSFILSWIILIIANIIIDHILDGSFNLMIVNHGTITTSIVLLLVYLSILYLMSIYMFKKDKIIGLLREIY